MATQTPTASSPAITLRPARLREYKALGSIAAETYFPTPFTAFLSPGRIRYYSHYQRGFQKRAITLMLDPRVRSIAACEEGNPDVPIGFIHFKRLGDDDVANAYIKQKASALLFILRWLFWAYYLLIEAVVGDKSQDPEAIRQFRAWAEEDEGRYWAPHEERKRRIHVLSFVVLKQFQGRGVGKKLMAEVTRRAVDENVVVGLEASPEGEFIYRRVGFEMLGRFKQDPNGVFLGDGGGIFMWTPPALKASNGSKEANS